MNILRIGSSPLIFTIFNIKASILTCILNAIYYNSKQRIYDMQIKIGKAKIKAAIFFSSFS